ncbi:MAG: phage tail sheath subtilisin-like domain-containing protein [Methanothrix sp.]|nr:phage tail sheath subtilisin-like domain-containing protein [Methanothrix sp.]
MAETILPGVYIEVRPEALIVPGQVTVGNLGVVGTASRGEIGLPTILDSYAKARDVFGDYDTWIDGDSGELTLVRALELAYSQGATTVFAVRVASNAAAEASFTLKSAGGNCVLLKAKTKGTWGNELSVNVSTAGDAAFVEDEEVNGATLAYKPVVKSSRNRIRVKPGGGGLEQILQIMYDDDADSPVPGQVKLNRTTGSLTFGGAPNASDTVIASYMADKSKAVKVIIRYGNAEETYSIVSGKDLVHDLNSSALVAGDLIGSCAEIPSKSTPESAFSKFSGGNNGASGADYKAGLATLQNENAHIIVAAGQDGSFGDELAAHCRVASTDEVKRDRIAIVGSGSVETVSTLTAHNLNSDRLIFTAPGIIVQDSAAAPPVDVELPGAYTAAAVAGLLSSLSPHVSLTNKVLDVGGLTTRFTSAELGELIQSRILLLEARQGIRVVRGITTSTNTAWMQITTRRIVDYAKFGVRSAAEPYIGLLNNDRVRKALKGSINGFLAEMVNDEMLVSYELDVTATRDDEIRGVARVTMTLRPTFSIDFIKVVMFLG